jgi:ActR/RegA family two-component response regulator
MTEDLDPLPLVLAQVADACGRPAALSLAASFGGRELYIPKPEAIDEQHPIALALGLATARKAVLGHNKLIIPMGPVSSVARTRRAYHRLKREGKTNSDIARALGIHIRAIERRNQRARAQRSTDPDLFD